MFIFKESGIVYFFHTHERTHSYIPYTPTTMLTDLQHTSACGFTTIAFCASGNLSCLLVKVGIHS